MLGRATSRPFLELTAEEWDAVVALNLTGTAFAVQSAAKMICAKAGPIPR